MREQIGATPEERWVIIKVSGDEKARLKNTLYYSEEMVLLRQTVQKSNFYPSRRPWYESASRDSVYKTEPYLFQHLKITGQSYSVRSKGAVIGVDTVLSSISEKIISTELGLKIEDGAEAFIFNDTGEVIASSVKLFKEIDIPASEPLVLNEQVKSLINGDRVIAVSNQNDWGPYDYTQGGEPEGYAIDVLKIIEQSTGIKFEFINGFNSRQLQDKYLKGDIDLLQSVAGVKTNLGVKSLPVFTAQLAIAAKDDVFMPNSLTELKQETVGVVSGFGMKQWLFERYPDLNIVEQPNLDAAKRALYLGEITYLVDNYLTLAEMERLVRLTNVHVEVLDAELLEFSMYMK